jgi:hypothetical protein
MLKKKTKYAAILGLIAVTTIITGCGNGTVPIVQNQEAIYNATKMRGYFDKSQGDFKALNAADQADAEKMLKGGPADVQKMFDWMKTSNKTAPARQ